MALRCHVLVVEIVEGAAEAGVEDDAVAHGQGVVAAHGPAGGVDCIGLAGRWVELELIVCDDTAQPVSGVGEDAVFELDGWTLAFGGNGRLVALEGRQLAPGARVGESSWT